MQHGKLRTDRCPWFIERLFKLNYTYSSDAFIAEAVTPAQHSTSTRSESTSGIERVRDTVAWTSRKKNQKKNLKTTTGVLGSPFRDLPEWLEEFTENLVDNSIPEH